MSNKQQGRDLHFRGTGSPQVRRTPYPQKLKYTADHHQVIHTWKA